MIGPRFDFTVNLGHIITFGGLLIVVVGGWYSFDGRLKTVEATLATATQTLIAQVSQGRDLAAMDARLSRLERIMEARP